MLELDDLGRFIVACQEDSHAAAAGVLGIAPSSLSVSLSSLADALGLRLFDRTMRGVAPTAAARWLFRHGLGVLHAEQVARGVARAGASPTHPVHVRIDIPVTVGRFDKAVGHAMNALAPDLCLITTGPREGAGRAERTDRSSVTLGHRAQTDGPGAGHREVVAWDRLVLAHADRGPDRGDRPARASGSVPVLVPRIDGVPRRWIEERFREAGADDRLELLHVAEDLGALETMLTRAPEGPVLAPESAFSSRLIHRGVVVRPLGPDRPLPIVANLRNRDASAMRIVQALRQALAAPEANVVMKPAVTARQLACFDLLREIRSVTGAARRAGVAQPAVTGQLGSLERTVAARLFERRRTGLVPTDAGTRFEGAAALLGAAREEIALRRLSVGDEASGRFELGILPAVGSDSFLVSRVARAIEAWRRAYPGVRLRVVEQPNLVLQARVRQGALRLGIITIRSPRMARVDLGSSERLVLVFNPAAALVAEGPVALAALARLPLALPSAQFGLRQLIDAAARARGLALTPELEVDSLSMCLALAREGRLGTVLPLSDVHGLVASGALTSRPIQDPTIVRTLQVIYATARTLTEPERELVRQLRTHLAASEKGLPR